MPEIIGIKFRNSPKVYYFSPKDIRFKLEDGAIVETARGVEYGRVMIGNKEVDDKEIIQPLKPVMRKATVNDQEQYDRNALDAEEALKVAIDKLSKYKLDMKFTDVEYTFDKKKLIFYFTAPGRVDFREYVRDLGATFKTRIELRQIHERDDFKMKGALAICGKECCCASHLNDFDKVSIKMAKNQNLSLNPQKISGLCGKLMCCLRYENDHYREASLKMPKEGSKVRTPDGEGIVLNNDLLRYNSRVRVEKSDGVVINNYSLDEMKFTKHHRDNYLNDDEEDIQDEELRLLTDDTVEDDYNDYQDTKRPKASHSDNKESDRLQNSHNKNRNKRYNKGHYKKNINHINPKG